MTRLQSGRRLATRLAVLITSLALFLPASWAPATALEVDQDDDGNLAVPTATSCPTIDTPAPIETWFNLDEMDERGYIDPGNHVPWDFATNVAQIICGAAPNAKIKVGMFFIRALGTMTEEGPGDRPESDPEVIYQAMEFVKKNRNVTISIVVDGGTIGSPTVNAMVTKRIVGTGLGKLYWCEGGCFNRNSLSVHPGAINHEKFMTISDTIWDNPAPGAHPAVYSSSGNWARSQIRNYWQEATLFYDDKKLFEAFDVRHVGMVDCSKNGACATDANFPDALQLKLEGNIWVDPIYRHYTDAGRGTTVSFAPAPQTARDYYIQQFDDVDCTVDPKIRIAMFKLSDAKAVTMVESLARLKKRGCDIKMILTAPVGTHVISATARGMLNDAGIWYKCAPVPLHTKLILIGPSEGNHGRVLFGTANMSYSALRVSDEHTVTIDSRRASADYEETIERAYGEYMNGWYDIAKDYRSCTP